MYQGAFMLQGYQAYSPVQHIPFGQQPVYFGNMTAQVPAPFVPTVPAVRTYATSYAAASKGTLQPDAAPFVSDIPSCQPCLPHQHVLYTMAPACIAERSLMHIEHVQREH